MRRIYTWEESSMPSTTPRPRPAWPPASSCSAAADGRCTVSIAPAWLMSAGTRQALGETGCATPATRPTCICFPTCSRSRPRPGLERAQCLASRPLLGAQRAAPPGLARSAGDPSRTPSGRHAPSLFPRILAAYPAHPAIRGAPAVDQDRLAGAPPRPGPRGMSRGWLLLFGLIGASLIPLVLGGSDMFRACAPSRWTVCC